MQLVLLTRDLWFEITLNEESLVTSLEFPLMSNERVDSMRHLLTAIRGENWEVRAEKRHIIK